MPVTLQEAWSFFSKPDNLKNITPAYLGFHVRSKHHGDKMYAGQIVEYTVKPVLGISVYWMTEITHVEEGKYFIDEQRIGPYSLWHHQHHFREIVDEIEMTDIIHYKIPLWFFGDIANTLFVRKQIQEIFDYRYKAIRDLFKNQNK